MRILDVLTSFWAIDQRKYTEILNVYQAHLRGPKIDWQGIEARVISQFEAGGKRDRPYDLLGDVAVIGIQGILMKEMSSFLAWLFGGSSMKEIGETFLEALDDPAVNGILLNVDSPGGTVDGTEELSNLIYGKRGQKPVYAYSDGSMMSAAYWIGSAVDKMFISGDTIDVGSIGVVGSHIDKTEKDKAFGEKYTIIKAGHYKTMGNEHESLSSEGLEYIQSQADYIYSAFIDSIARNRNVSTDEALKMADGKIYIGKQAIQAGLVDGVSTIERLAGRLSNNPSPQIIRAMVEDKFYEVMANAQS